MPVHKYICAKLYDCTITFIKRKKKKLSPFFFNGPYLNKVESQLPTDALSQVWME